MNKLMLSLTGSDVILLAGILKVALGRSDLRELKASKAYEEYLALCCLYEWHVRLEKKAQDLKLFGYQPGKPIKISVKRHEAVGFFVTCRYIDGNDECSYLPVMAGPAEQMIREILGEIHRQFLV